MESRAQLRAELTEAIAKVRDQIEIDQRAMRYRAHGPAYARLREMLGELEEALADLDADDGLRPRRVGPASRP